MVRELVATIKLVHEKLDVKKKLCGLNRVVISDSEKI
jgi:hypothetical protein